MNCCQIADAHVVRREQLQEPSLAEVTRWHQVFVCQGCLIAVAARTLWIAFLDSFSKAARCRSKRIEQSAFLCHLITPKSRMTCSPESLWALND